MVTPILYRSDTKYNYSSALMISARKGVLSGVLRSLEYGKADPNMEDHTLFFHWARVHGVSQKLPPPNVRDNNGLTPLHYMAINQELLWEDIDLHEVDVDQMERTFFLLLASGADVNAKTDSGVTAIQDALRSPDGLHLACLVLWNGCKWDPEYEAILDRNRRAHEEDKREIRRTLRYIRINGRVKGYRFLADEGQDA
ncbi:hypothetical protein K456DRAFT_1111066 [Colletotrichum gloeosporioides 23]|nr:hypothetical protein K456DRAFT_1111066 [Colletotrichum gloeosporioides 23]